MNSATGFCRKSKMQTGSSENLICWKSEPAYLNFLRSPRIDSKESILPAYVSWAGIFKKSMGARHRVGINYRTGPPCYIGWRNWCLGINSWAPYTFKSTSSGGPLRHSIPARLLAPIDCLKIPPLGKPLKWDVQRQPSFEETLYPFEHRSENGYLDVGSVDSDNLVPGLQGPILSCRGVVKNLTEERTTIKIVPFWLCASKLVFKSQNAKILFLIF